MTPRNRASDVGVFIAAIIAAVNFGCGGSSGRQNTANTFVSATVSDTVAVGTDPVAIAVDPSTNKGSAHTPDNVGVVGSYANLPLSFEANQGQTDPKVKFVSRGRGYAWFFTGDEAVLALQSNRKNFWDKVTAELPALPALGRLFTAHPFCPAQSLRRGRAGVLCSTTHCPGVSNAQNATYYVIRLKLNGADPKAKVVGVEELPGKANYFIGNDPKKWRTNVPTFAKVKYENIYPGVDLVYYGNQEGRLEYDFVVAPGADPKAIRLAVAADNESPLEINSGGDLVVKTGGGEIHLQKPVVYQEKPPDSTSAQRNRERSPISSPNVGNQRLQNENHQFLDGHYVFAADNRVGFEVPGYDRSKPLVIDPVLVYSTYLGGSGFDGGFAIAVDSSGSMYVTGFTDSGDFPTLNPFEAFHSGSQNAFVAKLNPAGTGLEYSSFLGGSANLTYGSQAGSGIAVDASGNAYIAGYTDACDFPTINAFQSKSEPCNLGFNPFFNGFVVKLNATGNALLYSTYLGGNTHYFGDAAFGVAVDSSGNAYVTGFTGSTDFPTVNPIQGVLAGPINAFVTKFNATGSALVYSTYLGGSGSSCFGGTQTCGDGGAAIALDSSGNAYVAGNAGSSNFPTMNPIQPTLAGGPYDAFVAKFNANGNALVYSTYLGGSGEDVGNSIAVDSSGSAYVTGGTGSSNFPTTSGAFQGTFHGGSCPSNDDTCGDAFVTRLKADGSALVYSTYLGGSLGDIGTGVAVDSSDTAFVTGFTDSHDFPTLNPLQTTCASFTTGQNCPFVASLSPAGNSLIYSTYLGGSSQGRSYGIALDFASNVYITGRTNATDFPTVNPLQAKDAGDYDVIVAKISTPPDFSLTPASASLTEPRGGQMTDVITVAPQNGSFASAIQLSCIVSGPLPMPTCALSPASVTPGANSATSTLTITAPAASALLQPAIHGQLKFYAAWLPLPGIVLFGMNLILRKQRDRRRNLLLLTGSLLALFAVLAGCGGGGSQQTQPQNYTVTVTGTSGAIQHTTQVTVIV